MAQFTFFKRITFNESEGVHTEVSAVPHSVVPDWLKSVTEDMREFARGSGHRGWYSPDETRYVLEVPYEEYARYFDDHYGRGNSVIVDVGSAFAIGGSVAEEVGMEGR